MMHLGLLEQRIVSRPPVTQAFTLHHHSNSHFVPSKRLKISLVLEQTYLLLQPSCCWGASPEGSWSPVRFWGFGFWLWVFFVAVVPKTWTPVLNVPSRHQSPKQPRDPLDIEVGFCPQSQWKQASVTCP